MTDAAADAEHVAALKREASAALGSKQVHEARKRYSEALRLAPRDLEARDGLVMCNIALGDAALAAGDADRAVSHYQVALELSPFHPEADAGLRRAAGLSKEKHGADTIGLALEAIPGVRTLRDLQLADRVVGKVAGAQPSKIIQASLEERRVNLAASGAPPREKRIEHEMAAAWRRRWLYRALPIAIVAASAVLWLLTGSPHVLTWGLLFGLFASIWDLTFVERGAAAAGRHSAEGPSN